MRKEGGRSRAAEDSVADQRRHQAGRQRAPEPRRRSTPPPPSLPDRVASAFAADRTRKDGDNRAVMIATKEIGEEGDDG